MPFSILGAEGLYLNSPLMQKFDIQSVAPFFLTEKWSMILLW